MSMRTLVLLLLVGLALPALAQDPNQKQAPPAIAVNGHTLPDGVVLGSTGDDLAVLASPYLRALGAQVRLTGGHLEAFWQDGVLILDSGSDVCTFNGTPGRLLEPTGNMGGDLVVRAVEVARVIQARIESAAWGVAVWKSGPAPADATAGPPPVDSSPSGPVQVQPGAGSLPPGLSMIPQDLVTTGSQVSGPPGSPPVMSPGLRGEAGPGLGGPAPREGPYEAPYRRLRVGIEDPVQDPVNPQVPGQVADLEQDAAYTVPAPNPSPSPLPGVRPARAVIAHLEARRIMTFHLSTYEIRTRVQNEGTLPLTKPFQVQLLARGERNSNFELLESFLVRPLAPGEEVELQKTADGHQFQSLQGMTVTFKAVVIEDAPPPKIPSSYREAPPGGVKPRTLTVEGSSREKTVEF